MCSCVTIIHSRTFTNVRLISPFESSYSLFISYFPRSEKSNLTLFCLFRLQHALSSSCLFLITFSRFTPTTAPNNRFHYFHPFFFPLYSLLFSPQGLRSHTDSGRNVKGRRPPRGKISPFFSYVQVLSVNVPFKGSLRLVVSVYC